MEEGVGILEVGVGVHTLEVVGEVEVEAVGVGVEVERNHQPEKKCWQSLKWCLHMRGNGR